MTTTMRDVANKAGVSVSTVSRALAGHRYVDEELRARIQATAKQLGYRPNAVARALRQTHSRMVGLVLPDIVNTTYATGAAVLQSVFQGLGYTVVLLMTNNDPALERDCLEKLREQRVDGVIHVPCTPGGARLLGKGRDIVPVVELFRHSRGHQFDSVVADDQEGAYRVVSHLAELGHTRIGLIAGPEGLSTTARRREGVSRAMAAHSIDPDHCPAFYGEYSREWGTRAFTEMLSRPSPPTAVFATSTEHVLGALMAAASHEIRIPEDVSLAGLGDLEWYQVLRSPITSYSLPLEEMAMAAAQLLITRISQQRDRISQPTTFTVSGRFIDRASTQAPAALPT